MNPQAPFHNLLLSLIQAVIQRLKWKSIGPFHYMHIRKADMLTLTERLVHPLLPSPSLPPFHLSPLTRRSSHFGCIHLLSSYFHAFLGSFDQVFDSFETLLILLSFMSHDFNFRHGAINCPNIFFCILDFFSSAFKRACYG